MSLRLSTASRAPEGRASFPDGLLTCPSQPPHVQSPLFRVAPTRGPGLLNAQEQEAPTQLSHDAPGTEGGAQAVRARTASVFKSADEKLQKCLPAPAFYHETLSLSHCFPVPFTTGGSTVPCGSIAAPAQLRVQVLCMVVDGCP